MLFISFHGGSGGVNNVGAYADSGQNAGTPLSLEVLSAPSGLLSELRAVQIVSDGLLWVASGSKHASAVLAFEGSGLSYVYTGTPVVQYGPVNSLWHPFDFTLDGSGLGYVSNQDTNVVARLAVAADFRSADTTPTAPGLPSPGTYLDATFVASSNGDLPGVPATTPIPNPAGLEVAMSCTPSSASVANSVRGVLWANGHLYVADEVASAVKVYDANGTYVDESNPISGPVHLVLQDQTIYAGSGNHVYAAPLNASSPGDVTFTQVGGIDVESVSGIAFGAGGTAYVALRDQAGTAASNSYGG